jgi:hypothetical protein
VDDRPNTNTSIITYTYKYIQNIFPKVGLLEETKGGRKEGSNVRKNDEIHHICVRTRHKETLKIVEQHSMGDKGEEA